MSNCSRTPDIRTKFSETAMNRTRIAIKTAGITLVDLLSSSTRVNRHVLIKLWT